MWIDQVIKQKNFTALYLNYFYRLFLKHIEGILIMISDGRDMHTHKSDVREFKSSELHILVKLSALFSFWNMVSFNVEISENTITRCAVISQEKQVKSWQSRSQVSRFLISTVTA